MVGIAGDYRRQKNSALSGIRLLEIGYDSYIYIFISCFIMFPITMAIDPVSANSWR
jgi:hypothetical protein